MVVSGGNDDSAGCEDLSRAFLDDVPELVIKCLVHLVQQQDLRIDRVCDGEAQPCPHALREAGDWLVEVVAESTSALDVLERCPRL